MGLSGRGGLAIAELIFYTPALPIAVYVGFKHGFGKGAGWYFLIILALVRIVGGATEIAAEVQQPLDKKLLSTAITLSSVGTSPLVLATLGIIKRLYDEMHHKIVPTKVFWLLGVLPLVGLILSIAGGSNASGGSPQELAGAVKDLQVAAILYLVCVVLEIGIVALMAVNLGEIVRAERKLYYAVVFSLPFLLVRIIYAVIASYSWLNPGSPFNTRSGSTFVQAFMSTLEEFVIVATYLIAALLTAKQAPARSANHELGEYDAQQGPKSSHATAWPAQQNGVYHTQQNGVYHPQQNGVYQPQQNGVYYPQQSSVYYPQQNGTTRM